MIDKIADQCGFEVPRVREPRRSRGPKRICQPRWITETVLELGAGMDPMVGVGPAARMELAAGMDPAAGVDPAVRENQQIKLVSAARIVQ